MKNYFIGVDSDGTVFDTMTVKHKGAFIPAAIEIWGLDERFAKIEAHINLYSSTRGIDRYRGLRLAFKRYDEAFRPAGIPPYGELLGFIDAGGNPPPDPSPFIAQVLAWNRRCDELFAELAKAVPPYDGAKAALPLMAERADIGVISSASYAGLRHDFDKWGLAPYTAVICGREQGDKAAQLRNATGGQYAPGHVLMIGDADGDRDAALANNALFFPIVPGHEEDSWRELIDTGLSKFFGGAFAGDYADSLYARFTAGMPDEAATDYTTL